jgi:hypothetical protein
MVEDLIYIKADGQMMCMETREMAVRALPNNGFDTPAATQPNEILVDFTQHLSQPDDPGTQPFIFYARVADSMRLIHRGKPADCPGRIENSDGQVGEEATRGQRVRWCDYSGPVGDGWSGIALFDHPDNPESPATFFTRGYGVFTVTQHYPEQIGENERLTLKWRAYIHTGDATEGRVEAQYREFIKT